jgi:hypothetical protein
MEISAARFDRMLDRDKRQQAAGRRSGDTRRGFKIPPDKRDDWNRLRSKHKDMSAREMGEVLGILEPRP